MNLQVLRSLLEDIKLELSKEGHDNALHLLVRVDDFLNQDELRQKYLVKFEMEISAVSRIDAQDKVTKILDREGGGLFRGYGSVSVEEITKGEEGV